MHHIGEIVTASSPSIGNSVAASQNPEQTSQKATETADEVLRKVRVFNILQPFIARALPHFLLRQYESMLTTLGPLATQDRESYHQLHHLIWNGALRTHAAALHPAFPSHVENFVEQVKSGPLARTLPSHAVVRAIIEALPEHRPKLLSQLTYRFPMAWLFTKDPEILSDYLNQLVDVNYRGSSIDNAHFKANFQAGMLQEKYEREASAANTDVFYAVLLYRTLVDITNHYRFTFRDSDRTLVLEDQETKKKAAVGSSAFVYIGKKSSEQPKI